MTTNAVAQLRAIAQLRKRGTRDRNGRDLFCQSARAKFQRFVRKNDRTAPARALESPAHDP